MSNYTDSEKEMHREMDENYAIKYLDYNNLVKEYCDYQALKRETEFYKETLKNLRASIFFMFVSAYIASCFLLNILNDQLTLLGVYFQSLLMSSIAFFISLILKAPFANSKFILGKENLPIWVYVILLVIIPVAIKLIF